MSSALTSSVGGVGGGLMGIGDFSCARGTLSGVSPDTGGAGAGGAASGRTSADTVIRETVVLVPNDRSVQ